MSNNAKLTTRYYLLSIQHLSAIFGATVLVPLLTVQSIAGIILCRRRHLNIPLLY
ncbi:hypothetical protein [Lacrimispora indolis]|uniref:hypothetical protein n=1 Tax=Lacrimispora indolis TaxID=69825 RepID=UPI0004267C79|nr:hypothetical protein [[Clostridium] methoxybenzovorans]